MVKKMETELAATEEAFELISTAYTLSQSDNIVQLRKQLKEGFGLSGVRSYAPPFTTRKRNANWADLLTNLSKDYRTMQQKVNAQRTALNELQQNIAARRGAHRGRRKGTARTGGTTGG